MLKFKLMKRVGILRGGKGKNYSKSLKQGGDLILCITENLKDKYKPIDILVDTEGVWHMSGLPVEPAQLVHRVDIVWNTGDQELATILRSFAVPVVSAPVFLPQLLVGIAKTPGKIKAPKNAKEVHQKFPAPWVVRTPNQIVIAKIFPELAEALDGKDDAVVEEFISGIPSAVHTISNFRGDPIYVITERKLTKEQKEKVTAFAKKLHQHLGSPYYLKTDFTLHPRLGAYVTNMEFHPDLRAESHLEESLHSMGAKLEHLVEHILEHP
jgi:hypothetical protein